MTYNHILVAVDLSPQSRILVRKAVNIARPYKSKLSLVHAYISSNTFYTGILESNLGLTDESALLEIENALKTLSESANYPVAHRLNLRGELPQILSDAVEKYHIDLVVCGHHHDFWGKLLSSARPLVNVLTTDLLIVPIQDEEED
ncbi:universal stress protein (plasmid) [Enterobacter ludwigii]